MNTKEDQREANLNNTGVFIDANDKKKIRISVNEKLMRVRNENVNHKEGTFDLVIERKEKAE